MDEQSTTLPRIKALLNIPVEKMIDPSVLMMSIDKTVEEAVENMQEKNAKAILVSDKGEPKGIVTKTDIIFKVVDKGKPLNSTTLGMIMSSPIRSLLPHSTFKDVLDHMEKFSVRQIVVQEGSSIIGVVTRDTIYEKLQAVTLPTKESLMGAILTGTKVDKPVEQTKDDGLFSIPLGKVMDPNILVIEHNKTVSDAIDLLKQKKSKLILVSNIGESIGIVSKSDMLFKVAARKLSPKKITLRHIMSSPVHSLSITSSVRDALEYMDKYKVRQIAVFSAQLKNRVLGMITRDYIYENLKAHHLLE